MNFKDSSEFLEYLQKVWHSEKKISNDAEQKKWREDFTKISSDRGAKNGLDTSKIVHKRNHYDEMVQSYVKELVLLLEENHAKQIGKIITVGSVNSNSINAVCTTDTNGNYAVVINSSLFTYLHKYGKILLAIQNPTIVTFCNRKDYKEITKKDLEDYLIELPKIYFEVNEPKGPMIHLDDNHTMVHMKILEIAEKFAIGHELGHYFCGHLDNGENTELFLNDLEKLKNDNYKIEFEADDFGFDLISDIRNKNSSEIIKSGIYLLFQGLNSLNPYASESHPAPRARMKRLLDKLETRKTTHNNAYK